MTDKKNKCKCGKEICTSKKMHACKNWEGKCHGNCTPNTKDDEGWEKEFDERFVNLDTALSKSGILLIKSFISKLQTKAFKQGEESMKEKVSKQLDKVITRETHKGSYQRVKVRFLDSIN